MISVVTVLAFLAPAVSLVAAGVAPGSSALALGPTVTTGTINGTAKNSQGQTLGNYTVRDRDLATGQLSGSTTSTAAGTFSFAGLAPGNYAIEVVSPAGDIVGTSAAVAVVAGAAVSVAVTASAAAAPVAGAAAPPHAGGKKTAVIITTVAVTAGVVGIIIATNNSSPSK